MSKLNLKDTSFADLLAMRDEIHAAITEWAVSERAELQQRLDALAAFDGTSSGRKRGPKGKRRGRPPVGSRGGKRIKVKPKYRGPNGELWSGRGLAPHWLTALEKDGKSRESFLIGK